MCINFGLRLSHTLPWNDTHFISKEWYMYICHHKWCMYINIDFEYHYHICKALSNLFLIKCDTNYCLRLPGRFGAHVIRYIYQDIITILTRLCIILYYLIALIIDPHECLSTHFQNNSINSSVLYHQIFITTHLLCAYKPMTTTLF